MYDLSFIPTGGQLYWSIAYWVKLTDQSTRWLDLIPRFEIPPNFIQSLCWISAIRISPISVELYVLNICLYF